jgi:hypothetical protein
MNGIEGAAVGDHVYFAAYKRPWVIWARDARFIICTRPYMGTVMYAILDLVGGVRGPDDRVFGGGYESASACEARLRDLQRGAAGVSRRRGVPLDVVRVRSGKEATP